MGSKLSYLKYSTSSQSSIESETPCSSKQNSGMTDPETYSIIEGMGYVDFSKLDDLLIDILSYISAKDLIYNCRLVCREWKNAIDGHSVWKIKCLRENKCIPPIALYKIPEHYYEKIYIHNPYGRNLIKNPCGQDGLNSWHLIKNGGDGFAIENPPHGADAVPEEVGTSYCFATACAPCIKYQVIDLLSVGVSEEILQLKTTKIQIGEWYAARFDCASEYRLKVSLLDKDYLEIDEDITLEEHLTDCFEFYYREEQWVGKEWHKITNTFENVASARYVFFQHFGQDCQYWAGNYGSKMTGAFVKVIV